MARLIDADKATKLLHTVLDPISNKKLIWLAWDIVLKDCETIDAEPVRHGKWIYQEYKGINNQNIGYYVCSECGYVVFGMDKMNRYCSYCGAKMEGEEE